MRRALTRNVVAAGLGVGLVVGTSAPAAAQDAPRPEVTIDEQAEHDGDGYVFTGTLVCGENGDDPSGEGPQLVLLAWQGATVVGRASDDAACGNGQDAGTWSVTVQDAPSDGASTQALRPGAARVFVMASTESRLLMEQGSVLLGDGGQTAPDRP